MTDEPPVIGELGGVPIHAGDDVQRLVRHEEYWRTVAMLRTGADLDRWRARLAGACPTYRVGRDRREVVYDGRGG